MSFLSFLTQKTYAGEFLKPEVVISRSYPKKVFDRSHIIIKLSFFKNAINSESLGVRE